MKELSVEEKAKVYDNVREKIATRFGFNVAEEIFSEYEESEDEKIRKALMQNLKERFGTKGNMGEGLDMPDVLAWLEKQGGPIDRIVKRATTEKQRVLLTETNGDANIDWDTRSLQDVKLLLEYGLDYIKKLEKQGEQKPAGKVEPKFRVKYAGSEYNVLEVKDIAGVTCYGIEDEPNHIDYVQAENCERVGGYSIKENGSSYPTKPANFSEQKPAWSEEELDSITAAINNLEYFKNNCVYHQMGLEPAITFLKSLKYRVLPQPKQEWSEEDEKYINDLIAYFSADMSLKHTEEDIVDWLKSLRPQSQWKPSYEQIEAIKDAIEFLGCTKKVREDLKSLYEQLKKLREE